MADVKRHELFPTVIHEFSIKLNDHEKNNMIYHVQEGYNNEALYQTDDDLHHISVHIQISLH